MSHRTFRRFVEEDQKALYNVKALSENVNRLHNPERENRITSVANARSSLLTLRDSFRNQEELHLSVLDALAEGILVTNVEERIVYANAQAHVTTGRVWSQLDRESIWSLFPPTDAAAEADRAETPDGDYLLSMQGAAAKWVRVRTRPLLNAKGQRVGSVYALGCREREKELEGQNTSLLAERRGRYSFNGIGQSPAWRKVLEQIHMVVSTSANVLICGEPGTGKEWIARAIHELSGGAAMSLVRVRCASVRNECGEPLGRSRDPIGWLVSADANTLFLDEIADLPLDLQARLAEALGCAPFRRREEQGVFKEHARIVAATSRNLLAEVRAGHFREDLYHRLSVFPIESPPLRDRLEDVPELAQHFLNEAAADAGLSFLSLTKPHVQQLQSYHWPGNIRELRNVIERAVILRRHSGQLHFEPGTTIGTPSEAGKRPTATSLSIFRLRERELILSTLEQTKGKIYGPEGAAALLAMRPTTLSSRLRRYGVPRPTRSRRKQTVGTNPDVTTSTEEMILD